MEEKYEKLGNLSRPPLFGGNNFSYQKVRTTAFIQGTLGDEVQEMIETGYEHPTKPTSETNPTRIKKLLCEFTKEEKKL